MKKCIFLSTDDFGGCEPNDYLLIPEFEKIGWTVTEISWKEKVNWNDYHVAIIRSTWDYQKWPEKFLSVLAQIDESNCVLVNSLSLVRWNLSKTYLQEMSKKECPIIPTIWMDKFNSKILLSSFTELKIDEIVIKPLISASSGNTFRLHKNKSEESLAELQCIFENKGHMIQPFIRSVIGEGEYSLFYFGNELSHCMLKRPKDGDFRVQEEHGGINKIVTPEYDLLDAAKKTLKNMPEVPLYVRLDFIRNEGEFLLMEIEAIEPSLYFNMEKNSPKRFVDVFIKAFGPDD